MPLEIRELVIKVTVEEKANHINQNERIDKDELKKDIIKECVNLIMTKLDQISDR